MQADIDITKDRILVTLTPENKAEEVLLEMAQFKTPLMGMGDASRGITVEVEIPLKSS